MRLRIAQGLISRDETEVKLYFDGMVRKVGVITDFGDARNAVIKEAENQKYDWMVFLDSDEELTEDSVRIIKRYIESGTSQAYALPRLEFVSDRKHYDDSVYPDWQHRIFKLGVGFNYRGGIHESLFKNDSLAEVVRIIRCPIYHYGRCMPKEFIALKYLNYERIKGGLPLLEALPEGYDLSNAKLWEKEIPFIP